jgi:hypothetical protein
MQRKGIAALPQEERIGIDQKPWKWNPKEEGGQILSEDARTLEQVNAR